MLGKLEHTDIDRHAPKDGQLDPEGVQRLLSQKFAGATDVIDGLNRGELNHRQGADPHDDLTILVFGFQ